MSYLFRDTDIAAHRLEVLATVFAPASRAFQQAVVRSAPDLAVDLGCGPGYTTLLLAETTQCKRSVGLDASENFIALARSSATAHISFLRHDVTRLPFPCGPGDIISCRMLLTHLLDPRSAIEGWATQLRPQGLLLLEEVEAIDAGLPLFRTYLSIAAAMLEQQGNMLYIGSLLDQQRIEHGLRRCVSRVYRLSVSTKQAATMFYLNILTWKNQSFVRRHFAMSEIESIERDLQVLAETSTSEGEIEWSMRQIAYERAS